MTKRLIIFDVDGTLANCEHRRHHLDVRNGKPNWPAFERDAHLDPCHDEILYLNKLLATDPSNVLVIVTGRGAHQQEQTEAWLAAHGAVWHDFFIRKTKDYRADNVVKQELLDQIVAKYGMKPYMVFDDRNSVVDMWRSNGIKCLQVEPGDF